MLFCKINSGRLFSSTVSLADTFQTAVDMESEFFSEEEISFLSPQTALKMCLGWKLDF